MNLVIQCAVGVPCAGSHWWGVARSRKLRGRTSSEVPELAVRVGLNTTSLQWLKGFRSRAIQALSRLVAVQPKHDALPRGPRCRRDAPCPASPHFVDTGGPIEHPSPEPTSDSSKRWEASLEPGAEELYSGRDCCDRRRPHHPQRLENLSHAA